MLNRRTGVAGLLVGGLLLAAGCTDDLPTATDDRFVPDDRAIQTLEVEVEGFLQPVARLGGFVDRPRFGAGLVANAFDGVLDGRSLLRPDTLPRTVTYTPEPEDEEETAAEVTDTIFEVVGATIAARVRVNASTSEGLVQLGLRPIIQDWDPQTVTWEIAADTADGRQTWSQPGGALGDLLAETVWETEGAAFTDSLSWELDAGAAERLFAEQGVHGFAVVASGARARMELQEFAVEVHLRPETHPDTVVTRPIATPAARAIFTPAQEPLPPAEQSPSDPWSVGGVFGQRVYMEYELPDSLPACAEAEGGAAACGWVRLDDVSVSRARLLLTPLRVPRDGFRTIGQARIRIRELVEPQMGRQAILGRSILEAPAPGIVEGMDGEPAVGIDARATQVRIDVTAWVRDRISRGVDTDGPDGALGLMGAAEGSEFGIVRFAPDARLRILYTILPDPAAP